MTEQKGIRGTEMTEKCFVCGGRHNVQITDLLCLTTFRDRIESLEEWRKEEDYDMIEKSAYKKLEAENAGFKKQIGEYIQQTLDMKMMEGALAKYKLIVKKVEKHLQDISGNSSYLCKTDYGQGVVAEQINISNIIQEVGL